MKAMICIVALLPAATPSAVAGASVRFEDGRTMSVERAVRDGPWARLVLDSGGQISVPAERVVNWEELSRAVRIQEEPISADGDLHPAETPWRLAAGRFADLISRAADRHELDPALLTAVARVESAFDPEAISPKGACGLLQLMPPTADRFGVSDVFDAAQNVEAGARYLSWLLARYSGRTDLALAGYNAGEGAVDRHDGVPPYPETRHYVRRVLLEAAELRP